MNSPNTQTAADTTAATPESGSALGKGLETRHLTMMGLGSAVRAGLFPATGVGTGPAGPAGLLAYIVAGIIVIFVMQLLGELGGARPASGTCATYGRLAFGNWAGSSLGWLYYVMLVMVMGAE